MPLTIEKIENAKPGINAQGFPTSKPYKPYKMGDSKGLFLLVAPAGGKWWRFKYRFGGKENLLSLGTYPEVTLEEARAKRDSLKDLLAEGIDPSNYMKAEKTANREEKTWLHSATRFTLDNEGALSLRLGKRQVTLTPPETAELRSFLEATGNVKPKERPCL